MQVSARTTLALGHPRVPKTMTVLYHALPRLMPAVMSFDSRSKTLRISRSYPRDLYAMMALPQPKPG